jgi:hypothetical protein
VGVAVRRFLENAALEEIATAEGLARDHVYVIVHRMAKKIHACMGL